MPHTPVLGMRRYIPLVIGMAACAGVCALALPFLRAEDDLTGPTLLGAASPVFAILVTLGCVAVAAVIAGIVGRFVNAVVGMFVLGCGLTILSWRTTGIEMYALAGDRDLLLPAVESFAWGLIALAAAFVVFRLAGPLPDVPEPADHRTPTGAWSKASLWSAACGMIMVPVILLAAQSSMKGQAWAAAMLGGLAAGLIARVVSPHVQPRLIYATPILFAAAAQTYAAITLRGALDDAFVGQTLSGWSRVLPLDLVAGSVVGVSLGLGWAIAFLHDEAASAPSSGAAPAP